MPSIVTGRPSSRSRSVDDGERPDRERGVGDQVVDERPAAERVAGRHRHQQEAGVRDARVGEQALDVALDERAEVAPGERHRGDDAERDRPELRLAREGDRQEAKREHERRHLRRRGHEARHGRGGALVDVGRPLVERCGGDLERQSDEEQREAGDEQEPVGVAAGCADRLEADLAGRSEDERASEEEDGRAEASDDEVLEPGLERRVRLSVNAQRM